MKDIFQKYGRIEQYDGMHFYEQDIVMFDYLYDGDIIIDMEFEYNTPGIGIVLNEHTSLVGLDGDPILGLLAKFGDMSFNLYKREALLTDLIQESTNPLRPDNQVHRLQFRKSGDYLYIEEIYTKDNIQQLNSVKLNFDASKFYVGIYSNKGNVIKRVSILDGRPQFWYTNIQNTNGGRISFSTDKFMVERAEKDAEIEYERIYLEPNRYFLDVEVQSVDGQKPEYNIFIFKSEYTSHKANIKNLLEYDIDKYGKIPYFDIEEPMEVNILFQCNSGLFKNLSIKDDYRQSYVSTDGQAKEIEGSYLLLKTQYLQKIEITGTIEGIQEQKLNEKINYAVYEYKDTIRSMPFLSVDLDQEYEYTFKRISDSTWNVTITSPTSSKVFVEVVSDEDIKFFKNVNGFISKLIITDRENNKTDIINQRTLKTYVSGEIESPIIVVDENDQPLDLSSSYRITPDNKYIFTNYEREWFKSDLVIRLNKRVFDVESVILYGLKELPDVSKIYNIPHKDNITSIDLVTSQYDRIASNNFAADGNTLSVDVAIKDSYRYFIVDYLKADSYCINKVDSEYEVDISTDKDTVYVLYDMSSDGQIRKYTVTNIKSPEDDTYIVLKKNEVV